MRLVATLLVRDEVDVVAATVEHHLDQGASMVVVTDNGSVDGTVDVLEEYAAAGVVDLIHEPDQTFRQAEWVTRMARRAAAEHGADWVVNLDADEFWVPKSRGSALRDVLEGVPLEYGTVVAHRTDLVGLRGTWGPWPRRLRWRNLQTVSERGTPLGPKVCHRADLRIEVSHGNHAVGGTALAPLPGEPLDIYHVPLRSWAQFRRKIDNGGSAYAANTELSPEIGWHWRADYARLRSGELEEAYRERLLDARSLYRAIRTGTVRRDSTLLRHLVALQARAVRPDLLRDVLLGVRPTNGVG